jgi:hypothetical protein
MAGRSFRTRHPEVSDPASGIQERMPNGQLPEISFADQEQRFSPPRPQSRLHTLGSRNWLLFKMPQSPQFPSEPSRPVLLRGYEVMSIFNQETSDFYSGVIVGLSSRYRVIICKDGLQWILQHRNTGSAERSWRGIGYFTTKEALLRVCASSFGRITPSAHEVLQSLPDRAHDCVAVLKTGFPDARR